MPCNLTVWFYEELRFDFWFSIFDFWFYNIFQPTKGWFKSASTIETEYLPGCPCRALPTATRPFRSDPATTASATSWLHSRGSKYTSDPLEEIRTGSWWSDMTKTRPQISRRCHSPLDPSICSTLLWYQQIRFVKCLLFTGIALLSSLTLCMP